MWDQKKHVRRVVLPSGKTIEVVYYTDSSGRRSSGESPENGDPSGLHICQKCQREKVQPLEWAEVGPRHWEMTLRCPDCGHERDDLFSQTLLEEFEEELDRGTEILGKAYKRLVQSNMEGEIYRFVGALAKNHILPMDF